MGSNRGGNEGGGRSKRIFSGSFETDTGSLPSKTRGPSLGGPRRAPERRGAGATGGPQGEEARGRRPTVEKPRGSAWVASLARALFELEAGGAGRGRGEGDGGAPARGCYDVPGPSDDDEKERSVTTDPSRAPEKEKPVGLKRMFASLTFG